MLIASVLSADGALHAPHKQKMMEISPSGFLSARPRSRRDAQHEGNESSAEAVGAVSIGAVSVSAADANALPLGATTSGPSGAHVQSWPLLSEVLNKRANLTHLVGTWQPAKIFLDEGAFFRKQYSASEAWKLRPVADPSSIAMEALASDMYRVAGVRVPTCRYYESEKAKSLPLILCRWMDNLKMPPSLADRHVAAPIQQELSEHFVLDALLQNYDLFSRGNRLIDQEGHIVRVDNGGSLAANAFGSWKATEYKCNDTLYKRQQAWSAEPFSLWDWRITSNFWFRMYAELSVDALVSQVKNIVNMKDALLKAVDQYNLQAAARVKPILRARIECLDRIAKHRPDLLDPSHTRDRKTVTELPREVCEGVRMECRDLFG